jgi:hypothetical protein
MTVARVVREQQASDARLALGLAAVGALSFPLFVLWPHAAGDSWQPLGVDQLWALGMLASVVIGPVVAGLAGWASLVALWTSGAALPAGTRRLHLATLVLVAALFTTLLVAKDAGALAWLSD